MLCMQGAIGRISYMRGTTNTAAAIRYVRTFVRSLSVSLFPSLLITGRLYVFALVCLYVGLFVNRIINKVM